MGAAVAGFYDSVRRFILQSLVNTFQQLPKTQLSQSLKADGVTLDDLVGFCFHVCALSCAVAHTLECACRSASMCLLHD